MKPITICILALCALLLSPMAVQAQNEEWQLIHQGNKAFKDGQYETAGSYYDKALQINPSNTRALYNMGNVRLAQGEDSLAVSLYDKVAGGEQSSQVRAMASHNKGYIFQRQAGAATDQQTKQNALKAAIAAYKQALRENPESQSSRYNLALCQKQLQQSQNDQQQQQDKDQQQKQQQQQQQQEQKQSDPLMNYARQAEQQTRHKINSSTGQRSLDKNW